MQAIADAILSGRLHARIGVVLSDDPGALILERARRLDIETEVIDCRGMKTKFAEEAQLETVGVLKKAGVDLVCLAGFLRLVKQPLLAAYPERILNIHPSLLPDFPGLDAWRQALEAGAQETGVTVHVVDAGMDTGPVVRQEVVEIHPYDDAQTLHSRIQAVEHQLYPEAISAYAAKLGF